MYARDPDEWGSFSGLDPCLRAYWTPPSAVVGCKIDCARLKAIIVLAKEMTFVREKFVSLDGKEMFKKGRFNSADVILVVPLPGELGDSMFDVDAEKMERRLGK